MDLGLLKTFLAVERAGSMRAAAEKLFITQPAITARIRELERQLDQKLFERMGRRLLPTEAGRLLAREAQGLLAAEEELHQKLEALRELRSGTLRLATIDAVSIYVLPAVYLEYRRSYPGIALTVQVVDSRRVLTAVRELDVEIGFLALPPSYPETDLLADLDIVPIYQDEMVCVASPSHPLAAKRSLRLRTLAEHPLVLYDQGSTTRTVIEAVFGLRRLQPHVVMQTASPEAMKRLAEVGVGVAILPRAQVAQEITDGRLVALPLRDATFERTLATVVRKGRSFSLAARRFQDLVHDFWPPLAR